MKNAVEKWERLRITPPHDELHVPVVGLSAVSHPTPQVEALDQPATVNGGEMPLSMVESPAVPAIETPPSPDRSKGTYHVDAAHSSTFTAGAKSEETAAHPSGGLPTSQLSQRLRRVQETCARLLPIKGRSARKQDTRGQIHWLMRLLFHPEAVVVLLLIVACFLAIVILDDREETTEAVASISETAVAPSAIAEAASPFVPAVPASPVQAATAPSSPATPPVADGQPAPTVETPVASEPPPQTPGDSVEPPKSPAVEAPLVAQTPPPTQQPPVAASQPAESMTDPAAAESVAQNPATPPFMAPHANTYPTTEATPSTVSPPSHQPRNASAPRATPPYAAANLPTVLGGQYDSPQQQTVWPQRAPPMFQAPPASTRAPATMAMRPQPQRIMNPTYASSPSSSRTPATMVPAAPPANVPEQPWPPTFVARRPPQFQPPQPAARLRGTIVQPPSRTLHEHY